jgi:hypothetical protein
MTNTAIITCNCSTCNGLSARVKGDGTTAGGKKITATAIHNLVRMAHSPLAKAASTQANGPWAV